jgi:DNA-3-methyladenine glycosylase
MLDNNPVGEILSRSYFARPTLQIARSLLGKFLVRTNGAGMVAGKIIEVEAYVGPADRASHASRGRTPRTDVMFGTPGVAYVYLVYGMHHCFNVVTEREGYPAAVLIRAVEIDGELVDGPGRVCKRMGIDRRLNRLDLTAGDGLWLEDRALRVRPIDVGIFPRIGVDYAGEWAKKPWRFRLMISANKQGRLPARQPPPV